MGLNQKGRALYTDLYELTMAAAYFEAGLGHEAAFELFVREMPPGRSYLVCAGLEQVVSYLGELRFTGEDVDYLRGLAVFRDIGDGFFEFLRGLRFSGRLIAMPEGTPVFAGEPLLRVEAPIVEAQVVETFLLSMVNFQTLVASKAARVVAAARGDGRQRSVVDFGARRAHGPDAAVLAARACYIAGCVATSVVEAGRRMGIPVSGTEAHSFIMNFATEEEAFRRFYECFGDRAILLVDTYDTLAGTRKAIRAAPGMGGVRIDSGDVAALSGQVRRMLDEAGLPGVRIVASGDLDEYAIAELVGRNAPVDGFGVGTRMVTSQDAPSLGGVYKMVAIRRGGRWQPRLKLSPRKATYPGRKQVQRFHGADGRMAGDVIAGVEEPVPPGADALLGTVMEKGRLVAPLPGLDAVRDFAAEQIARLPGGLRALDCRDSYPVRVSDALQAEFDVLSREIEKGDH